MNLFKKILGIFRNMHFQYLIGNGVLAILSLLTLSILYHGLSISDIGIYVFFITINTLLDTLKMGFLTNAYIKFSSGDDKDRFRQVDGSAWIMAIVITLFLMLFNLILSFTIKYFHNDGLSLFSKYFWLFTLSTLPSFMGNLAVQVDKRFDRLFWIRFMSPLIFTILISILIYLKKANIDTILIAYIIANFISSLATIILGWTKIQTIIYARWNTIWELFHFGKYSLGTSLSANLFKVTDTVILNFFLGQEAIAMYNLGGRLIQIVEIPLLSLATSGMPILASHFNNNQKDEMVYFMKKIIGILTLVFLGIALVSVIFADPIITLIGGHKYIHSIAPNLFRIFIVIAVFYPTERFFAITLEVIGKPVINFYKILIMLLINLVTDYVGIILFKSVYPIVITNIFSVLAGLLISYFFLSKYIKLNFWDTYRVGYNEILVFLKDFRKSTFSKKQVVQES